MGLELTGVARRAGVRVLAGTDYIVPGADLHRELDQLVVAGLSPAEALRMATARVLRYGHSRSRMRFQLHLMHRHGLIRDDDLTAFSPELREEVFASLRRAES